MADKFKILSAGGDSKGLNIFKSSSYKEHLQKPMAALFWKIRWAAGIWLAGALAFGISFIIEHIWRYGWSPATAHWTSIYLKNMFFSGGLSVLAEIPDWFMRTIMRTDIMCLTPLIPVLTYHLLADATLVGEFNPHGKDKFDEKSSNKATKEDIEKMGLFKGFMMVLGYFKKKPLMMNECLSTLCVAPPGTGKSQGVVFPTIFECNNVSMIINDPKPELKQKSSAYRATVGPVFIMNWAGQDDPASGIYYPSWNPLSPEHVPFNTEDRDLYVDVICDVLIAEKASSSADPHWTISGRSALSGLIQFMVSKIERAKADDYFYGRVSAGTFDKEDAIVLGDYYTSMINDPNAYSATSTLMSGQLNAMNYVHIGTWAGIPDAWRGKEASLSMLLDWLNFNQIRIAEELENRRRQGDQMVMMADPMKDLFLDAVREARQYSYAHRSILELTQLANTPDKERGSILSTVMAGLGIFRNAAVRNRTSHSDFHFSDLRGLKDPRDGKIKPVSVYLSINMVNAEALNPITGIFIELMSKFLLANAPGAIHAGEKLGTFPVLFVLDEMPKMQKLQAVIQGPDLGRGQQISYLIIGQDIAQIREKYGADAAQTIISTTAAKIVLRQNDPETAKRFSDMMGHKMKIKETKDDKGKVTETPGEELLYSPMDIMKLSDKKQLVIFQGYYNRPIEADKQMAYKDDRLKGYMDMGEASPLPEFLIPHHHAAMGYGGVPKVQNPMTKEIKIIS
ncbi:MAG: type IV secretory system conjugative DNA transfer family protein [Rickettsiales bacterium]|jgi:type IV secretory pathway TraG/TraD family ATPase VirD4|nr:type IV secretory system conjugative DNA transfer family protein [Rickettsiales bacterium]